MSNAFTNWLTNARAFDPKSGGIPILKDYQHASRLFVDDNYSKSPKVGFLFYVLFNINENAIIDEQWKNRSSKEIGLLVKKIDLPKFQIVTETLNQYNRKTVVQTKLTYQPVSIDFHDDNSDITNNLWINYYKYYYKDSNYGGNSTSQAQRNQQLPSFKDTKFQETNYSYGRYGYNNSGEPFFSTIDIYVLHQQNFTQFTLVNPKITDWSHDTLEQSGGGKILQNKMSLMYENVLYNEGTILTEKNPEAFGTTHYDTTKSPLQIGITNKEIDQTNRQTSEFDKPGKNRIFGTSNNRTSNFDQAGRSRTFSSITNNGNVNFDQAGRPRSFSAILDRTSNFDEAGKPRTYGLVGASNNNSNAIMDIAAILLKNKLNKTGVGRAGPVGYTIANSAYRALSTANSGKYSEPPSTQNTPGVFNLPGGVGINIFKGLNTGVDGKVRINPAAIILPKLGGK